MGGKILALAIAVVLSVALAAGCAGKPSAQVTPAATKGPFVEGFRLTSPAFEQGGGIPARYTCAGENVSPPLEWGEVPEGAKSLALICDDPDAPRGTFVHWVIFNIPPSAKGLAEGIPKEPELSDGSIQGRNDFGEIGYGGPCPPPGPAHRYFFKLYALDTKLDLPPGATKAQVLQAMQGHVLAQTELMGRFAR